MEQNEKNQIRHTVVFKLKHPLQSAEEAAFLEAANELKSLPGVSRFECMRQISNHSNFTHGISMEFEDAASYQAYSEHPEHQRFVEERWFKEVESFLEIDYQLNGGL